MEGRPVIDRDDDNEVRRLRKAAGYATQAEAALRFEYGLRTWAAWELGERPAPRAVIELLEREAQERTNDNKEGSHG